MSISHFHPIILKWFTERFGKPTEAQKQGWPSILEGNHTLIAAPTGSGKTLAAFLACLDKLIRQSIAGDLPDLTRIIYISPLKALSNDIKRNLEIPLSEIRQLAEKEGFPFPEIRVHLRTGDTPAFERRKAVKHPPHIVVTTPESVYLLLTAESSRRFLHTVESVIVDEIHAVAGNKRGSHLSISLERLEALCEKPPLRIGLSATQRPVEEMARFLVGSRRIDEKEKPACTIINAGHLRQLNIAIETPDTPLSAVCSNEQWGEIYRKIAELIQRHRSTVVFVNTRRLAERVTFHLTEMLGANSVASHHGSLSRKTRLNTEDQLKQGALKAVVATASLELGIDIGFIDLVIQIGSPRSIAVFLQRIGRSGHALGVIPKGKIFALTRDELIECAALLRAAQAGRLDHIEIPIAPLDILSQQMIAASACEEWEEDELFNLIRGAYPYRNLKRNDFERILQMLTEGFPSHGRTGSYLYRDQLHRRIKGKRGARLAAITSGGAMPEPADYKVVAEPDRIVVGSVDEDFAMESLSGDVFLLGNTSWRILNVHGGEVTVFDTRGAAPTIPFWRGEAPSRTFELSSEVSDLRTELECRLEDPKEAARWLVEQSNLPETNAVEIIDYLTAQKAAVGMIPTQKHLLIERFFDESGGMQLVIHAPFGGRINRAFGLALRKRFCRTFDFELQASADDNGILLSIGPRQSFPLEEVKEMVSSASAKELLIQALLAAPVFMIRWRWNVTRSLAVLRYRGGKKVPPALQRFRSDDLLSAVFPAVTACPENLGMMGKIPIPDHPLIQQTIEDALQEAMDAERWIQVLKNIENSSILITTMDTREPTPFSYQILNANPYAFLDGAPLEERRTRAVATRRTLSIDQLRDIGKLDPGAIEQVKKEAWPLVRDADELHDCLLSTGILPREEGREWEKWWIELVSSERAAQTVDAHGKVFWIAVERWPVVKGAYPEMKMSPLFSVPPAVQKEWPTLEACTDLIRGRMEVIGPVSVSNLAQTLNLPPNLIETSLTALEKEGVILRGQFTLDSKEIEWCNRRLLARIHRITLNRLREQISPISPEEFIDFLLRWTHLSSGTQLQGIEGVHAVLRQLQGFEIAAKSWEREILPGRIFRYNPLWLDELCFSGTVIWGRTRLGSIREANKNLPLSLMLYEDFKWIRTETDPSNGKIQNQTFDEMVGDVQTVFNVLNKRGALFSTEVVSETRLLPSQVEVALWKLIASGRVSGDGFQAIRRLTSPIRRHREFLQIRRGSSISSIRKTDPIHRSRLANGRWWIFQFPAQNNNGRKDISANTDDRTQHWCWQLLERYGIIFRDLLARENAAPPWHELLPVYRTMELRGEIRGGRFVTGVGGEQFARPEVIDLIRQIRNSSKKEDFILVSASDPLNLAGILTPHPRVTAIPSNALIYFGGKYVGHRQGKRIWIDPSLDSEIQQKIEKLLISYKRGEAKACPSQPFNRNLGLQGQSNN